jgi:immune inhibitor A
MEQNMKSDIIKILSLILFILFLFLIFDSDLCAVSLAPELIEKLKKEGRLEEVTRKAMLAREKGIWQPTIKPPLKREGKTTQVDTMRVVVLLVDFDDNVSTYRPGQFDTLCFSKDFVYPTGSVRDYYWENSYQTLVVIGDVYGWYRMPRSYVAYTCTLGNEYGHGVYPWNAQKLVEDAVSAADPDVDFSQYDRFPPYGRVDALFVIHAGPGAEQTGDVCDIWSHKYVTYLFIYADGVAVYEYAMDPERRAGGIVDIGVICHEFGHVLGAVDLYDYDNTSEGLGKWSIMAYGSWNDDGHTPAHFDAWHKYKLGFSEVNWLTANQTNAEILQAETSPVSYRLWTSGGGGSRYFLVENRQKVGFDSSLPGHGLLIYHVDEGATNNDGEWCPGDPAVPHYKVALEQADGHFDLEGCYGSPNQGDAGDPFPGWVWIDKRAFDDTTMPGSRDYYDDTTQVAVWNISDSDSAMSANLDVTWSRPGLYLVDTTFDDMMGGDGDGRPEAGETVKLYFTISNIWLPITGTTVTGRVDTLGITFTDSSSFLGNIGTNGSANNNLDPMEFEVDSLYPGRPTIFTLHVEGNTTYGIYTHDFEVEVWAGNAEILLVDDDYGSASDYKSYYTDALDSLKQLYDIWDTQGKADPDFSFNDYKYIIWYTGDHKTNLFTQAQVESLMSFLDHGGRLFLTSQDAAEVLSGSADPLYQQFLTNYLHVDYDGNTNKALAMEEPGDEIGDTLWIKPWGIPGANNQTSKDILVPDSQTDTVLVYADPGWVPSDLVAGTKFKNENFRVVLFGFGFEAITSGTYGGKQLSPQHFVMQRVMDWLRGYTDVFDFEEEHTSIPKSIDLFQNYPNPFNPNTSIQFTVISGQPPLHTTLKIYNIRGQLVKTLVDEQKPGGDYSILWDGKDESGKAVSSGIYFYKLTAGSSSEVKKMVLLK